MVPQFQLLGPSNSPYPGTVCLPQVPLPANVKVKAGDKATIQVVELAQHGAALYSVSFPSSFFRSPRSLFLRSLSSVCACVCVGGTRKLTASVWQCVDIIFAEPGDPKINEVNESNCFNSQELGFADVYTITVHEPIRDESLLEKSGAGEVTFWYLGRNRSRSLWGYVGWVPVALGGLWVFI